MSEYFDIVDENGIPCGGTVSRQTAHEKGIRHRTAHVWVVSCQGGWQILLQKRSMGKESYPGEYDTSAAGHIGAGDDPLLSACRELYEELGIKASYEDMIFIGTFTNKYEQVFHGHMFRDNEVSFVYVYRREIALSDLVLQEEEVESVRWFDLDLVEKALVEGNRKIGEDRICVPSGSLILLEKALKEKEEFHEIQNIQSCSQRC